MAELDSDVRQQSSPGTMRSAVAGLAVFLLISLLATRHAVVRAIEWEGTTVAREILLGSTPLFLAAAMSGVFLAVQFRTTRPSWRHALPVTAGIAGGFLAAGLTVFGPALAAFDGEGNADAAPATFIILGVALLWAAPWPAWPRDATGGTVASLTGVLVAVAWWNTAPSMMDCTTGKCWFAPLVVLLASSMGLLTILVPHSKIRSVAEVCRKFIGVGLMAIVVGIALSGPRVLWGPESIPAYVVIMVTVFVVPLVPVFSDSHGLVRIRAG